MQVISADDRNTICWLRHMARSRECKAAAFMYDMVANRFEELAAWYPIEQAPRDGYPVLAGGPGEEAAEMYYDPRKDYRGEVGWQHVRDVSNFRVTPTCAPVCWRPLPRIPKDV